MDSQSQFQYLFEEYRSPAYEYPSSSEMDTTSDYIQSPIDHDDDTSSRSSVTDVDRNSLVRRVYGRQVQTTNDIYMLPADIEEHSRLDIQHDLLKTLLDGSLFIRQDLVDRVLSDDPSRPETPNVLDIGTGSGAWAVEVAHVYPNVQVTGLDLAPANFSEQPPLNCTFEIDDVNLGLQHYANTFDVVHCRDISQGITDYEAFVKEDVYNALKPGGVFLFVESDLQMYDDEWEAITAQYEDEPGFSWMQKMTFEGYSAMKNRGSNIDACHFIDRWFRQMGSSKWASYGYESMYVPIGPYEDNPDATKRYISEQARENALAFSQSLKPLLVSHGYFEHVVDKWIRCVKDELLNTNKRVCVKWHFAWAVKRS
ncbi:hypothetical protein FRC02_009226 [Tulasnella sp. 418]|nr:hypothetical protein FRC02_009226 [Tulasnella sp. 418]